jgi:hypothetical protein
VNLEVVSTLTGIFIMMSIITKSLKTIAFGAFLATSSAYATDISMDGTSVSVDDRADAGQGGSIYDINQMDVSWASDNTITVDIFTNFANTNSQGNTSNNKYRNGSNRKKIVYGDLLIGANNNGSSDFNYAFSLGDLFGGWNTRFSKYNRFNQTNGGLYEVNGTKTAGQYHGYSSDKGSVFGNTTGSELNAGTSSWSAGNGKVSFSFNVSGLDAFKNATSLSLSWAMSCYNDAVHDTFAVNRGNKPAIVPEPSTMILMLLALVGITYRQRSKRNSFSA